MASDDRRIQLRESIHQLVTSAAASRCVSPAALVSMVMYDYLRNCGELIPITTVIEPDTHAPKPRAMSLASENAAIDAERARQLAEGNVWYKGQWVAKELAEAAAARAAAIVDAWDDDD